MIEKWPDYRKRMFGINADFDPQLVQDGWVYLIETSLQKGIKIDNDVLNSHSEIEFIDSIPYHRKIKEK